MADFEMLGRQHECTLMSVIECLEQSKGLLASSLELLRKHYAAPRYVPHSAIGKYQVAPRVSHTPAISSGADISAGSAA